MNAILLQYFNRLKSLSSDNGLKYFLYERDVKSSMPYSVHFSFLDQFGIKRNSWGNGDSMDEAFGKSLMEMIERIYFSGVSPLIYKNAFGLFEKKEALLDLGRRFLIPLKVFHPSNTNGVAIHLSKKMAIDNAILELIERHTILYSLLRNIGPTKKIIKKIPDGRECVYYIWQKCPMKTVTVVGAISDEQGSYFSSSCDFDEIKSVKKAELELNSFLYLDKQKPTTVNIINDDIQSFNRYHRFSGDHSAIRFFNTCKPGIIPDLEKKNFFYTKIPTPNMFKNLTSLWCVRVIHPDVQQLFFDNWNLKYLNPRIFPNNQKLPDFPHIIA